MSVKQHTDTVDRMMSHGRRQLVITLTSVFTNERELSQFVYTMFPILDEHTPRGLLDPKM